MKGTIRRVVEFSRVSSRIRTKIISVVFVLTIATAGSVLFSSANKTIASDITIDKIIEVTNKSRKQAGESTLVVNPKLMLAAQAKAEDMIANNYFSHTSPAGTTPWIWIQKEDYDYTYAGENLAMDFHAAEKMEEAWMASATHRANILNKRYREIGTAVKEGKINGHDTMLAVVMFGSGNRNISSAADSKKEIAKPAQDLKTERNFPALPIGEEKKSVAARQKAVITIPQAGAILSESEIKIIGRSNPGEEVSIFDNGKFVDTAIPDSDGWFSTSEKEFSAGEHSLAVQNKNRILESATEFYVDREKPSVDFRFYADESNPSRFFLEASADKNNCKVQFNGEARYIARGSKAVFPIDSGKSAAILRVSDEAGNKNFKQINIANYYSGNGKNNISEKMASLMFSSEDVFAADSGREAVKNNLGIAMGGINKY